MTNSWYNTDGLYLKFGTDKTTANTAGEYRTNAQLREVEIKLTLSALTQTETIQSDVIQLPAGARIQELVVVTTTLGATGAAIDLGLIRSDRTTEIDYDGLLAAFPLTSMDAAGEQTTIVVGSSYAGALIGTTLANNGFISCSATTGTAFTAGVVVVKIRYYIP